MSAAREQKMAGKDLVVGLGATGLSVARYLRRAGLDAYRLSLRGSEQAFALELEDRPVEPEDDHDPPGQLSIEDDHHQHRDDNVAHCDGSLAAHWRQYSGPGPNPILDARSSMLEVRC